MNKEKTEKSPYLSKYGAGYISPNKYLAELMCERFAQSQGKELGHFFWRDSYWKKKFLQQIQQVNILLEKFSPHILLKVIEHTDLKWVYSWGAKSNIIPLAEHLQREEDKQEDILTQYRESYEGEIVDVNEVPRTGYIKSGQKKQWDKLKELDREE